MYTRMIWIKLSTSILYLWFKLWSIHCIITLTCKLFTMVSLLFWSCYVFIVAVWNVHQYDEEITLSIVLEIIMYIVLETILSIVLEIIVSIISEMTLPIVKEIFVIIGLVFILSIILDITMSILLEITQSIVWKVPCLLFLEIICSYLSYFLTFYFVNSYLLTNFVHFWPLFTTFFFIQNINFLRQGELLILKTTNFLILAYLFLYLLLTCIDIIQ